MSAKVRISLECSLEAARTLLPFLFQMRHSAHLQCNRWCCVFVRGLESHLIGDISFNCDDDNLAALLDADIAQSSACWTGSAQFVYEINGEQFEHQEQEVILVDMPE